MDLGKNDKMNLGAMGATLNQNIKKNKQKERMLEKLKKRREAEAKRQGEMMAMMAQQAAINAKNIMEQQQHQAQQTNEWLDGIQVNANDMDVRTTTGNKKKRKKKKKKKKKKNKVTQSNDTLVAGAE